MTRPILLSAPNIPKPLHGLNPRTIMGKDAWDRTRQEVYKSTDYCCAACGVHKSEAKFYQRMEAHEIFDIDYSAGTATLVEIVPLCHFCHSFIHSGLLRVMARKKQVSAEHVRNVLRHGVSVMKRGNGKMFFGTAILCDLVSVSREGVDIMPPPRSMADWGKWRMIWNGVERKGPFKSFKEWERKYK